MNDIIKNILFIFLLLIFTVLITGCFNDTHNIINDNNYSLNDTALTQEKYVAVKEKISEQGNIIEGSYPFPKTALPPLPFYYQGPIANYPSDYPVINDSLKLLYATNYQNESPQGLTTTQSVFGVYNLPYYTVSGPIITNVDRNGTLHLIFCDRAYTLPSGEIWKSPIVFERIEIKNETKYNYTVKYITSYEIINFGIFNKSDIN